MYPEPEKVIAISDLEGNFYALKKILVGTGVMSPAFKWTFNTGHLVIIGDIFDRGNNVTQLLWLLYELERQAALKGGKVHVLIGNHENMNLRGNTKYVTEKYTSLTDALKLPYKELFGVHTELGRWLRTKNTVVKIGNSIYVHGGLSIDMVQNNYSLDDINTIAKKYYGNPDRKNIEEAALVFDTKRGPLWYRGYFKNDVSNKDISKITSYYNVKNIIVGHTVVDKIKTLYKSRIIAIDLKHPKTSGKKTVKALLKENNSLYIVNENNDQKELK